MDTDHSGVLSKNEVKECLGAAGFDKKFIKVSESVDFICVKVIKAIRDNT